MTNKTGLVIALVVVFLFPAALMLGFCAFSSFVMWELVIPSFWSIRFCLASGLTLALVSFFILLLEDKSNDE